LPLNATIVDKPVHQFNDVTTQSALSWPIIVCVWHCQQLACHQHSRLEIFPGCHWNSPPQPHFP